MRNLPKSAAPSWRISSRHAESGYALLMIMFFTALLLIATMVAAPRIMVEGKRDKEQEMIWRGKQYVRGVKLYYRKMGRFPTSLDDLTKPKVGSLRFMRQPYKDPMNNEDGSWRLIYVGPAGQLIGSLKPPQTLQLPGAGPGLGTAASTVAANSAQQPGAAGSSAFGSSFGSSAFGAGANSASASGFGGSNTQPGSPPQGTQQTPQQTPQQPPQQPGDQPNPQAGAPGQPGQPGTPADGSQAAGADANAATSADSMSTPQGITPTETPTIIGGNIVGVGSKKIAPSLMVYEKAKNYHLFEFVWDPSKDTTIAGQPPMQTGTGLGQGIGGRNGSSFGSSFGSQPGTNSPTSFGGSGNPPNNASPTGAPPTNPPPDQTPTQAPPPEQ